MSRFYALALATFFSFSSLALVDVKNGNYTFSRVDYSKSLSGFDLRIKRTYNSRSDYNGLFGFGWCSEFETRLVVLAPDKIMLKECGAGRETIFTAQQSRAKTSVNDSVELILNAVSKARKVQPQQLSALAQDLKADLRLQLRFIDSYDLKIKPGFNLYTSEQIQTDRLVRIKDAFVFEKSNGIDYKFNSAGRLTELKKRHTYQFVKFVWQNNQIKSATHQSGDRIVFTYNRAGYIQQAQVASKSGEKLSYDYNQRNLIKVSLNSRQQESYTHNPKGLLMAIQTPFASTQITYNKSNLVEEVKGSECTEKLNYKIMPTSRNQAFTVETQVDCNGLKSKVARFQFKTSQNEFYKNLITQVAKVDGQKNLDIVLNQQGQPVFIQEPQESFGFKYDKLGRLVSKSSSIETLNIAYDKAGQLRSLASMPSGRNVSYVFNKKNQLIQARTSWGVGVAYTYDLSGRLITIAAQSQKNNKIQIAYKSNSLEIARIALAGVGAVELDRQPYAKNSLSLATIEKHERILQTYQEWLEPALPVLAGWVK